MNIESTLTELRKMADQYDAQANTYAELNAASGLDREIIAAKKMYATGIASGFRQAAFLVEMEYRRAY